MNGVYFLPFFDLWHIFASQFIQLFEARDQLHALICCGACGGAHAR